VNPISDRGPAPSYYDPPDERPVGPHAACLGYGCHLCEYTGEMTMERKNKNLKDAQAEVRSDADRDMRIERGI
jgi:hypothetical protein